MIEKRILNLFNSPPALLHTLLLLLCGSPGAVLAQATMNPYATAQLEHDSNIFRVQNSQVALALNGDPRLSDTDQRYVLGLNSTYLWSQQKLTGTFEGRKIDYNHFTVLNHYEYLGDLRLDWKLTRSFDGIVEFRQERLAAAFANRDSTNTLEVDTDRNVIGKLNYNFNPDWRLETGVNFHTLKEPLQFFPDFVEHETGSHLGLTYLGLSHLTYGFALDRIDGNYTHAIGVGPYSQTSGVVNMNYAINGLTSLAGALGYTRRDQTVTQGGKVSGGLTGQLAYTRQLTGKTVLVFQVARAVNSYAAAGGSEIDTTASLGLTWQATYKIAVAVNYAYTRSTFLAQAIPGAAQPGRIDHSPAELANVTYQALKRLQLKGYISAQNRQSNYFIDRYSDTIVGIELKGTWR